MKGPGAPRGSRGKIAELAVASAVLLIATALSYVALERQLEDRDSITHTHLVLEKLGAVRRNVAEPESAERGYLLGGDDAYLAPYGQAVRDLRGNISDLGRLTGDNPVQRDTLNLLDRL